MNRLLFPDEQNYWVLQNTVKPRILRNSLSADVVIVGGGMAGISAAQFFSGKGMKVVLLERYFCGSGATGKSSGFITPNAELGLSHYVREYGPEKAKNIWAFVESGVSKIRNNVEQYGIECNYIKEDTFIAANSVGGLKEVRNEFAAYQQLDFESSLYDKAGIRQLVAAQQLEGGMLFGNTFAINGFEYVQAVKQLLMQQGVQIYEETPVIKVNPQSVQTLEGIVKAQYVVVCTDRFLPELDLLKNKIFQVQTFVMLSKPLEEKTVQKIFPNKRYMLTDTDLVYQYYRMTRDNRFLIGGSSMWHSFQKNSTCHPFSVHKKLVHYVKRNFPQVDLEFEYMWPGMIGISKDLQPIIGRDERHPTIYYVGAATGLPWAAALGIYAGQHLLEGRSDFDQLFSPTRKFPLPDAFRYILGKANTFALSNLISLKF